MTRQLVLPLCSCSLAFLLGCAQTGARQDANDPGRGTAFTNQRPVYTCHKVSGVITIDGQLTERCWRGRPTFPVRGLADGGKPPHTSVFKMAWDDEYLYFGGVLEDADVWSRFGLRDIDYTREEAKRISSFRPPRRMAPESLDDWQFLESDIHKKDKFVKLFLDPDSDGLKYVEFHINPLNNIFDAWYERGFALTSDGAVERRNRGSHVPWTCEGLVTATHVEGTLNAPHDTDKGWSFEMAIPWKALAPFCQGSLPPRPGDVWGCHLGRKDRDRFGQPSNIYWTWPVIGLIQCHLPSTWGKLLFGQ